MELSKILKIEKELLRFQEKLESCKMRIEQEGYTQGKDKIMYSCRETGALKRAALDLKQILTQNLK